MPLPIKQYKHMFKDVKFLATTAQPSYREVSHWIDLLEDPTGGTIKVWNGAEWKKISGEGDSDTELVIGDTTGTAYDGGKGKELETAMDQVHATTNELQDTISSLQTEIESKKIFQFSYLDLQNKTEDFIQRFFDAVSSGTFNPPMNTIFLYRHGRDDLNKYMNLYMTVSNYYFSIGQPIKITFYSTIYHDKDRDRDQFIKLTATISTGNITDNPTFEIEEIPFYNVEHFDYLANYPLFNGIEQEEHNTTIRLTEEDVKKYCGGAVVYVRLQISSVYDGVYVPTCAQWKDLSDDDDAISLFLQVPQVIVQNKSLKYKYLNILIKRPEGGVNDRWTIYLKGEKDVPDSTPFITDAPANGKTYGRKDSAWTEITIPDTSTFATKEALATKLDISTYNNDKAEFVTNDDLATKQDALVSGTNIKTINGNSLLGEGNIEIQGGGDGITDAPSDGKKYVRQNANWVEETTVDTSNFATTAQLANKVDTSTYTEDKATFATKAELANKANTSDLSNYLTTTDAESNYAKKSEIPSLEGYLQTSTADEKYATKTELSGKADTSALASKQDILVSGTNIKTINNQSLLGNGNIDIAAEDSKVYVFELSKYITSLSGDQRFTGIIPDEAYTALNDAIDNDKLILGKMTDDTNIGFIPLQISITDHELVLKGEFLLGPICLVMNANATKTYQGYFYSEMVRSNDSSTVTISPLPDELIDVRSGTSTLTNINVDNLYNFRLIVTTKDQSVMLNVDGLDGVIGTTFTGSRIALEANSQYEIDVENNIAVVAKINKPQAM